MTTLLIAEHDNHSIKPATLNAVTAAAMIGGSIHLMIIGTGCTAAAQQAAGISGVDKVLRVDAPQVRLAHAEKERAGARVIQVDKAAVGLARLQSQSGGRRRHVDVVADVDRVLAPQLELRLDHPAPGAGGDLHPSRS